MSKRNLVIIIALLVIVDIAAALWYFSLRIEASGESHELWPLGDTVSTMADTLTTVTEPDSFQVQEFHAYYVSRSPAIKGDLDSYYVSVRRVKVRWPLSVNGLDSVPALDNALLMAAFGKSGTPLSLAATHWLRQPKFTVESVTDYREIEQMPKLVPRYAHCEQMLVYPILTSLRLLVMQVDHRTHYGETSNLHSRYVHYDRVRHMVLDRKHIINAAEEPLVLTLINTKIERLNHEKKLQLERAGKVANDFRATRAGIVFEYPAGEIAPASEGVIEVLLDYPLLGPALTQEFKNLLNLNDGYWKYKPIDHNL